MKKITLQKLIIKNFKGIKEFTLDVQGHDAKVLGDNGTGKTTNPDAFNWGLFEKDSQNKKDFQLKTVDPSGKEFNNLEHEVEIIFSVDGEELSLRKVFKEKWTRKRGQATAEFSGHTTDYYVNGVPSKKKDYTEAVANLINEDIFKLLTSPLYFNEQLHWQKRRELLLEISGDITNEEVVNSNKSLAALENILNGKSIEDHRKIIASKRAEINKELTRIPVRIDEVRRSIVDVSELNESAINEEIEKIQALITQQEEELSRIQNGTEVVEKQKKLREIESSLIELKNEYKEKNYGELNALRDKVAVQKDKINQFNFDIKQKQHDLNIYEERLKASEKNIQHLREAWVKKDNETFDEHKTTCSMCGQEYPEEQKQEIIEKFNIEKSQQLEEITNDGKLAAKDVEQLKVDVSAIKNQLISLEAEKKESERVLSELKTQYEELKNNTTAFEETEEFKTKQSEISSIQEEIQRVKDHANEEATLVREKIMNLKEDIRNLERDKAKFDQVEASNKRIEELEAEEKTLAKEFEELEHQLFLTEEFIRSKVTLLEEKINSKFKYARFKLFETQINGGLTETCETLYEGVPYSRGLNNAARINVGLDIISTLSEHFGVSAPIFIDNSEAVTKLIPIDAQVISLIVSEEDKTLRVEVKS
ncbi:AAA family ATPase [Priestia aryabhattai]|uniref:AAA family ATPase n=1 Tax=Priestia aryabhattai TaxID=412384 RepID=UPI00210DF5C9|nr:AAA family ATPase [Priestia aryabhattai]